MKTLLVCIILMLLLIIVFLAYLVKEKKDMLKHRFTACQTIVTLSALSHGEDINSKLYYDLFEDYDQKQIKTIQNWLRNATDVIPRNTLEFEYNCKKTNKIEE